MKATFARDSRRAPWFCWLARGSALAVAAAALIGMQSGARAATAPVPLGTAANFAVLAGSTITNTGATTINGDLGLSPGTSVTGFPPGQVNGTIHAADSVALQAQADLTTAYNDAAAQSATATIPTELGGTTETSGVYVSAAGTFGITGTLTLDAQGDPNAVFIFQAASTLITASASNVSLINGTQASNVFWVVGSSATLGTSSTLQGSILALTSITVTTGTTIKGRALARNGAVTLDTNTITADTVAGPPTAVSATPGDTTATISWTAPTSLGTGTLTGYKATATAASNTFTCTTTSAVTCVITGLTDGTTYSVTVVTLTTVGSSPPSSPAVNVKPVGILSLTSPTSLTWAATGTGLDQSTVDGNSGDQQLTATDNTATGAGWHITVSATTFTTGPKSLPNTGAVDFTGSLSSSLAGTAPTATCVGACALPTDTTTYPVVMATEVSSPTVYTVYDTSVSTGEGVMTIGGSSAAHPIGWWVQVPASAYAGSYTSTVTLEVISGP